MPAFGGCEIGSDLGSINYDWVLIVRMAINQNQSCAGEHCADGETLRKMHVARPRYRQMKGAAGPACL
jgi:hypothetical protein